MGRVGWILAVAVAALCGASAQADMLNLGPLKPKVTLFDVPFDPTLSPSVDVETAAQSASVKTDTIVSMGTAALNAALAAVARKQLPVEAKVGFCVLQVAELESFDLSVTGNTAILRPSVKITSDNCGLLAGSLSVEARFVPAVTPDQLSVKLVQFTANLPFFWRIAGDRPEKLMEAKIKEVLADKVVKMPVMNGIKAAFQAASLDAAGGNTSLRLRADAVVAQAAIMDLIKKFDDSNHILTVKFPQ
jgi:hypothetical protein